MHGKQFVQWSERVRRPRPLLRVGVAVEDKAGAFQVRTDSERITCQPADSCHQTEAALLQEGGGEMTRLQPQSPSFSKVNLQDMPTPALPKVR